MEDLEIRAEEYKNNEIIDINLKQEVGTEVDDFYIGEYIPEAESTPEPIQLIGQKRKNTEGPHTEILKKIKQETVFFEESSDVIILNTLHANKKYVNIFTQRTQTT